MKDAEKPDYGRFEELKSLFLGIILEQKIKNYRGQAATHRGKPNKKTARLRAAYLLINILKSVFLLQLHNESQRIDQLVIQDFLGKG